MFVLSKLLSAITQPLFWVALVWFFGLLTLPFWRTLAVALLWSGLLALGLLGFRAVPDALLRPIESQYTIPHEDALHQVKGIIVLGGGLQHPDSFLAHGQVPLGEASERMTVPLTLMREHPEWSLVFSGGEGRLALSGMTEATMANAFYQTQGLDMTRVQLEKSARNTRENAQQVQQLLGQLCHEQQWLLVTSAWHMPRAMTEFEAVGCKVMPYPVDFRTGVSTSWAEYAMADSLMRWQLALHEWLGAWVYEKTR